MVGRCYETEQILPFGPWVEALRAAVTGLDRGVLGSLDPTRRAELARLLPEIAEASPGPASASDDYLRLFEAVARLLEILTVTPPFAVILEDLHWADEMSVRLFGFLARRAGGWPLLLVGTSRAEEIGEAPLLRRVMEELRAERHVAALTLSPLSEAETHDLVQILGSAGTHQAALGHVAEQVWTLSEGNPFVAVETMRALHEGHRFGPSTIALPERVREAIGSRLERLSPLARDVVAVAAVIGRQFDFALLQRAAGLDEREAAAGVEELVRRRVLHGVGVRLDFAHDRIRQVAYGALLPARRTRLHAAVGNAIESTYGDALAPHHGALGVHYRHGEIWDRAVRYLRLAGNDAVACSASREAVAYSEQALEVVTHLPEGMGRSEAAYNLEMMRAALFFPLAELPRALDGLREAEALAHGLRDDARLGRVNVLRPFCLTTMGEHAAAIETGERGLAMAESAGLVPFQAVARVLLGFAHIGAGNLPTAITFLRRSADLLEGQPAGRRFGFIGLPAVLWRSWLVMPLAELGVFPDAIAHGEEAIRIAEEAAQPYSLTLAHATLGHAHCIKGDYARAIPALERFETLCRDYEIPVLFAFASWLGYAYAMTGRLAEAVPLLEDAVERSASLRGLWWQSRRMTHLAEAYLWSGRVDDARRAAERALALADTHGERGNRAYALRLFGELEGAGHYLEQARALAEELGMRPLVARCQLELGRLYRRVGDSAQARPQLTAALANLRAMDMRFWAEQADAELASAAP
ncbi:MAG: tetratricopeptide repeat protein [Candidatus Rokubacteria bacterium]|nr:tetratricopeptide repeat protein [Candidatus Rokubacteria bacterium]